MKIFTSLFLKPLTAVKSLLEKLLDNQANNSMIRGNGKYVGYVGRDGLFTPFDDNASETNREKSDSSDANI
jgi:hypothetical protein